MENNISIDSCDHIIQNNPKSSPKSFLKVTDWEGFENVEKPKEKKGDDDEAYRFGNPEHGDEKTHYLVDNNPLVIFFSKKYLRIL